MLSKINKFFSSVKLAIYLFIAIASLSVVGTLINQGEPMSQYKKVFGAGVFHILYGLGFLNIFGSWYFIGLSILLIINLIAASVNIFPRTLKAVFGPFPSFKEAADKKKSKAVYESFESKKDAEEITKVLNSRFGVPAVVINGSGHNEKELYYSKNSIFRFSPYIAHLSVIIILTGVLLNVKYGFRSFANINVGQKTNVSYLTGNNKPVKLPFTIRLDKYQTKYYPNGMPKAYTSKISIIEKHVRVLTKNIGVNHPLTYGGITLYQASYGQYKPPKITVGLLILDLKNRNFKKAIYAQAGKLYDAGTGNIKFRFIAVKKPQKGEIPFFIRIYLKNDTRKINFHVLNLKKQAAPLIFAKYNGAIFLYRGVKQIRTYYYSGIEITKNSYTSVIWFGSIILIISLFFSFFFNHREIWVRISGIKDGKKIQIDLLAQPKKKFESFYKNFNKKTAEIKKELT